MKRVFGKLPQNRHVVRAIEAALHRAQMLGVGPFRYIDRVTMGWFRAPGGAAPGAKVSIALANSGNLQIELLQQSNDAASMYHDFPVAGREGQIGGPDGRFVRLEPEAYRPL